MGGDTILTQEALLKMQNDGFMQNLLDTDKVITEIYHKLRGEVLIEELKPVNMGDGKIQNVMMPVWKKIVKSGMNDEGVSAYIRFLSMCMTSINATGDGEDFSLKALAFQKYSLMLKKLLKNMIKYDLSSEDEAYEYAHLLLDNVYNHYTKSIKMGFLKENLRSYSVQELRNTPLNKDKEVEMTI